VEIGKDRTTAEDILGCRRKADQIESRSVTLLFSECKTGGRGGRRGRRKRSEGGERQAVEGEERGTRWKG